MFIAESFLSREFGNIIICAAYVPPSGKAVKAASCITDCVHNQLKHNPGARSSFLADWTFLSQGMNST